MNKILFFIFSIFLFNFCMANTLPYDFEDTHYIPILMSPTKNYTTKEGIYEGQEINFRIRKDVICHGCLIVRRGTIVKGKIETIVTKGMNGFPAEIIIDNFKIQGIEESQLMGEYVVTGKNLALIVYPIKWMLTPIPFAGTLTNFIMGGEAKIERDDVIAIKYFPHWK